MQVLRAARTKSFQSFYHSVRLVSALPDPETHLQFAAIVECIINDFLMLDKMCVK